LVLTVTRLLSRAARAISLDDENLRQRRIALLAIRELSGQGGYIKGGFAPRQIAGLARGFRRRQAYLWFAS